MPYIISLWLWHPKTRILIVKYDFKSAFGPAYFIFSATSAECLTTCNRIGFTSLWITFGGSPCPALWRWELETICDFANDLIQKPLWHPNDYDYASKALLQSPHRLPNELPYHPAQPLNIDIPLNDLGLVNVYTNDVPLICLAINDNAVCCSTLIPFMLHLFG